MVLQKKGEEAFQGNERKHGGQKGQIKDTGKALDQSGERPCPVPSATSPIWKK